MWNHSAQQICLECSSSSAFALKTTVSHYVTVLFHSAVNVQVSMHYWNVLELLKCVCDGFRWWETCAVHLHLVCWAALLSKPALPPDFGFQKYRHWYLKGLNRLTWLQGSWQQSSLSRCWTIPLTPTFRLSALTLTLAFFQEADCALPLFPFRLFCPLPLPY